MEREFRDRHDPPGPPDEEVIEAGPDAGGYTAEEDAMRVRPE